jgi:electron transport complex protein RnfB
VSSVTTVAARGRGLDDTMNLIQRIDALLPQTQCGKCGHPGCKPYAEGIAKAEAINKCPPGGDETIAALARLLDLPRIPLDSSRGSAPAVVAFIREAECIGCTKCIQACPVDAIVGAARLMHTVLVDECTGCDLCVAPCPVDCIDLVPVPGAKSANPPVAIVGGLASDAAGLAARQAKRDRARRRFEQRNARLLGEQQRRSAEKAQRQSAVARAPAASLPLPAIPAPAAERELKQAKIAVAMNRAQFNKSLRAFGSPPTAEQHAQLAQLHGELEAAERLLARLQSLTGSADPARGARG